MSCIKIQNDSKLLFLGTLYTVRLKKTLTAPAVTLSGSSMEITLCSNTQLLPLPFIRRWYLNQAGRVLKERTSFWAAKMQLTVNKITLRDQKTRWGSCSSLGNINYNWRIIMAPPEIVDYLVIHELSHLIHMNHSASFWQQVAQYSPQHKKCRLWLRQNAKTLLTAL